MIAGHRWEYDYAARWYRCVSLPIGGVESYQWCVGCGVTVTDKELYIRKLARPKHYRDGYVEGVLLDLLAISKGNEPIEAGTYAEYKLRQSQTTI